MEAARVAALRGHRVTLCEKGDRLGGTAFFSALVYPPNGRLVEYLETQVGTLPIDVRLGTAVTPQLVRELGADVVLVAVGARREPPPIPGIDRPNVLSGDDLRSLLTGGDPQVAAAKLSFAQRAMLKVGSAIGVTGNTGMLRELSRHWMPIGTRVVILGGGLVGIELAEFLTERDRTVTVLEAGQALAAEMALPRRWRALYELREHGVPLLTGVQVEAITDDGVVYSQFGERNTLPADAIIVATGTRDNRALAESLSDCGAEVRLLGDCKEVGYLTGAILDAAQVARAI
jgi:2,4-dienoyl-CoA reductase (NADPH2)